MIRDAAIASLQAKLDMIEACRGAIACHGFGSASVTILNCSGKVIVTGMGKSGHIGRKIGASLQSTGTRAAFLHPGDAAHGDMGMIGSGDVLLMLSNSGETDELRAIMGYASVVRVPVIMITSNPESSLAAAAHVVLAYPKLPEGCPLGRAPMASTVAQLTIGDALVASVMTDRGFTEAQFGQLHHGGYLGRSIATAA